MMPNVRATFDGGGACLAGQSDVVRAPEANGVGGVSSFGLNGTIAHVVLSQSGDASSFGYAGTIAHAVLSELDAHRVEIFLMLTSKRSLAYCRRSFPWRDMLLHSADVARTRMYSLTWATASPVSCGVSGASLLLSTKSIIYQDSALG